MVATCTSCAANACQWLLTVGYAYLVLTRFSYGLLAWHRIAALKSASTPGRASPREWRREQVLASNLKHTLG